MSKTETEIPFEDALELLSNNYRRDILKLITIKERYAFELSKILNISQRAVSNHLTALKDAGLVLSEKRKSSKGPDREYFHLERAVVLSLTVAPNLFLATLRNLDDKPQSQFASITPELQLGSSKQSSLQQVIDEGMELLPQIKEGLQLLETQQSKLLRGYQGLRNHIRETLERNDFTTQEIRIMLLLVEHDGKMTMAEVADALNIEDTEIPALINPLIQKEVIVTEPIQAEDGTMDYSISILTKK